MADSLSRRELDLWLGFRFMVEETSLGVSRELLSATGMLGGQFGILSVLLAAPSNSMRQQHVANAMRWDRTRLSHQLTRMERSGWIQRKKSSDRVTLVVLTASGRKQQRVVEPVLGAIVRRRFLSRLTKAQLASLEEVRQALTIVQS